MTINLSDNSPRISYSVAQGVTQSTFTVPFEFFSEESLNVYVDSILKTLTTDYTTTGGNGSTGSVVISVTGASGGSTVVITREIPLERTADFPTSGPFQIGALNTELDRIIAIAADVQDTALRSIRAADSDATASYILPLLETRKGTVLAFNETSGDVEVGPQIANVQSLANVSADIALLADIEDGTLETNAITNVNGVRTHISSLGPIASDITTVSGVSSNVTTVAGISGNVTTVSGISSDVATLAAISSDVTTAANNDANITTVSGISSNVTTVAGISSDVTSVSGITANVTSVANVTSDVTIVAGIAGNVTTAAGISADITTVAADGADIGTVAGISSDVTAVANNSANVSTVAGNSTNINTVAGQTTNLQNVTDNLSEIQGAAANASAAATSATAASDSAAAAAAAFDSFDDKYLGSKTGYADSGTGPTTDNDGNALVEGSLFFSSDANEMRVYDGANWIAASSAGSASLILYEFTATSGQTTFSGVDDNGATFGYTTGNAQFVLNGVILDPSDYTATNGTSVVLASGAATGDLLNIYAFKSFTVADTVSASAGGTFAGNVTFNGSFTSLGIDDNATSTAMTLDSSGNVGIGTSSPSAALHVDSSNDGPIFDSGGTGNTNHALLVRDSGNNQLLRVNNNGNVGIGSSAPGMLLEVDASSGSANDIARFSGRNSGGLTFRNATANEFILHTATSDALIFGTNGNNERMRIDSSGNLLVGKTANNLTDDGIVLRGSGELFVTRASDVAAFNRRSSDGNIVTFRKDGTTVGSIGVAQSGDRTYFAGGSYGIASDTSEATIMPCGTTGTGNDGVVNLGKVDARFKDLYLSGGVYLGGTGSANKLDDYEEGTFNPFSGVSTAYSNTSIRNATYTKIGRMVSVDVRVGWTGTDGSGSDVSLRLPFTSGTATGTATSMTGAVFYEGSQLFSGAAIVTHISASSNSFSFYRTSGSTFSSVSRSSTNGTYDFVCSFVYYVP